MVLWRSLTSVCGRCSVHTKVDKLRQCYTSLHHCCMHTPSLWDSLLLGQPCNPSMPQLIFHKSHFPAFQCPIIHYCHCRFKEELFLSFSCLSISFCFFSLLLCSPALACPPDPCTRRWWKRYGRTWHRCAAHPTESASCNASVRVEMCG